MTQAIERPTHERKAPTIKDLIASPVVQSKLAKVASKNFDSDRLAQAMLVVVGKSPKLQNCSAESLLECLMTAAQQHWTIGGPRPGMYMVPYLGVATAIPSYFGFQQTARESDGEWEIEAAVVRDGDEFQYRRGLEPVLSHIPHDDDSAPVTHVYAIARSKDGRTKFDVMTTEAVEKIRARSRAANDGPWVTDWDEMAKKTVVKRVCKMLPSSPAMDAAIELSNQSDGVIEAGPIPSQRMSLRAQAKEKELDPSPATVAVTPPRIAATGLKENQNTGESQSTDAARLATAAAREPDSPAQSTPATVEGASTVAPSPRRPGRPKAKAAYCGDCGAPMANGKCSLNCHARAGSAESTGTAVAQPQAQEAGPGPEQSGREPESADATSADPRTPADIADEYAQIDVAELRKICKAIKTGSVGAAAQAWAREHFAALMYPPFVDDMTDDQVREVARSYKLRQLDLRG